MIFRATVNGVSKCISYLGQNTCNTGVNVITLDEGPIGYSNLGECDLCFPPTTTTTTTIPIDFCVLGTEDYNLISSELEEYLFEVPCYTTTTTTIPPVELCLLSTQDFIIISSQLEEYEFEVPCYTTTTTTTP